MKDKYQFEHLKTYESFETPNILYIKSEKVIGEKDKYELDLIINDETATTINYILRKKGYKSEQTEEKYPNGLFVFAGSVTTPKFRGQGLFSISMYKMLLMCPDNICVQVPITNKILESMFLGLGFNIVKTIDHWGILGNSKNMQLDKLSADVKSIIKEKLDKILKEKNYMIK
jgi:hypothetical protein